MDRRPLILALGVAALVISLLNPAAVFAQTATPSVSTPAGSPTATTRILAIGTIAPGADIAAARAILPIEVRETVQLYLEGKIDQWYSLQTRVGVVFVLNTTDLAVARDMLEQLPLGRAHLMSFELLPLAPLGPLSQLQGARDGGGAAPAP